MKKLILSFTLLFILTSCNSGEEIQKNEVLKNEPTEAKVINKEINWSKDLKFTYCDSQIKHLESSQPPFNKKEDVVLLEEKMKSYNEKNKELNEFYNYGYFPYFISEYCKTEDSSKYIFSASDKRLETLGIYDKDLDVIMPANFKYYVFKDISNWGYLGNRNYGDTSLEKYYHNYKKDKSLKKGFGAKNGNIVNFVSYGVSLIGNAEIGYVNGRRFFTDSNGEYCTSGLTAGGKLSVCFADVYYKYDLSTNTLYEDKICTFYIDDNGEIKTLQKCFQNTWKYKGYDFITGAKGTKIYQNKKKDLKIIDVNLEKSGISFGGVIQTDRNRKFSEDGYGNIKKYYYPHIKSYDLQSEKDGSNYNNFIRQPINEAFGDYNSVKNGGKYKKIFAVVNGQFFNATKINTTLSFPVKSNGQILNSLVDNDKKKRTLTVDKSGNVKIIDGYKEEYLNDKNNVELLVGINPNENFGKYRSLGRTYVGLIGDDRLVFFVAKSKTQNEMKKIALDYGVKEQNLVMLDGGPSSQFAYFDIFEKGGGITSFEGGWPVPHYVMIYQK